jgi:predicted amidohydrolase
MTSLILAEAKELASGGDELAELAKSKKIWLHLGSLPLREQGELSNASVLISPTGEVKCSYQKIHLFDISLPDQVPVRESDVFKPGSQPQILEINGWHIGQTICYDLRFSELFNWYAQHSVELILVPSAFLVPTGKVHWEILLRARAIESQAYVVASAQAGHHIGKAGGSRDTFGNSLVVDPWGQIIAQGKPEGPQTLLVMLDMDKVQSVRRQIPMKNHRRLVTVKR